MRTVTTAEDLNEYGKGSIVVSESRGLVFKMIAMHVDGRGIYLPLYFFEETDRSFELTAEYILGTEGGSALLIDINSEPVDGKRLDFGDVSGLSNIKLVSTQEDLIKLGSTATLIITEQGNCFEPGDGVMQSDGSIDWAFHQTYGGFVNRDKPGFSIETVLPFGSALLFFWDKDSKLGEGAVLFDRIDDPNLAGANLKEKEAV